MPDYVTKKKEYGRTRSLYTRAVTAFEAKIDGDANGHTLGISSDPDRWGSVAFICSCGWKLGNVSATANGAANTRSVRVWKQHLEDVSTSPNTRVELGTIQRKKGPLQTIFVALKQYAEGKDFKRAATAGSRGRGNWSVYSEAGDGNLILYRDTSRDAAITSGLKHLDIAERRGSIVVRENVSAAPPRSESVRSSLAGLLTTQPENLEEVSNLLDAIEEVLLVVPMLEQRRDECKAKQQDILVSLIGNLDAAESA